MTGGEEIVITIPVTDDEFIDDLFNFSTILPDHRNEDDAITDEVLDQGIQAHLIACRAVKHNLLRVRHELSSNSQLYPQQPRGILSQYLALGRRGQLRIVSQLLHHARKHTVPVWIV